MLLFSLRRGILRCAPRTINVAFTCLKQTSHMDKNIRSSYEEAVYALNGLQSNAAYLQEARIKKTQNPYYNIQNTGKHLKTLGIQVKDLDHLNIIHVSGTKGKGSTCAFTESILRHHGLKTGFYSSPHLITVNERIRINGFPLEKKKFATYFWQVFQSLHDNLEENETMPGYFCFLTVMTLYVFVKEKVDVTILEVGIGGLYDCTNVIEKPVVVGVSTLGLDHVTLLGNTLELIAQQKAGIFKPGVPAFTVPQPDTALNVLAKRAHEVGCTIAIAPPLSCDLEDSDCVNLGIPGAIQSMNASLAVQLCRAWLSQKNYSQINVYSLPWQSPIIQEQDDTEGYIKNTHKAPSSYFPMALSFKLNDKFCKGLQNCIWPGRFHSVKKKNFTFYLDGAHTAQSMKHCVRWFADVSREVSRNTGSPVTRVLIFNCTGQRNAEALLSPLSELCFDLVLFTPNCLSLMQDSSSDQSNFNVDPATQLETCKQNQDVWCHIMNNMLKNDVSISSQVSSVVFNSVNDGKYSENVLQFSSLGSTMQWLLDGAIGSNLFLNSSSAFAENAASHHLLNRQNHVQVFVTGSLHLVGGVLSIIDPELKGTSITHTEI